MKEGDKMRENIKPNRLRVNFLRFSSALMLLIALPMFMWCLSLINSAALDYDYAGVGCFLAGLLYVFSMVSAIAGLTFATKPYRYRYCQILAYFQLISGIMLIVPLLGYTILTLIPLYLLTILYLFSTGWRFDSH